ncbi:sulfatase-like hydrolase/transferase [Sabulilitoribacter arenilitoris]|uniref:Sulfatase-like hydrolase/transferase n=1 Tax=Wocania arenilitoris TaxID=2044858 RepID=A0AAE3EK66_9FLAO|nr:LTA synthase family protein [Wocania arenilitoris]MCF7567016.1 sulfatase-like hydrolase/transferase [Wocania arenilitoris]
MAFKFSQHTFYKYIYLILALIIAFWSMSLFEAFMSKAPVDNFWYTLLLKLINDFWGGLIIGALCFPLYFIIQLFSKKGTIILTKILFLLIIVIQYLLVKYSLTTMLNLGADILGYSFNDAFSTVSASESFSIISFIPFIALPLLFTLAYWLLKWHKNDRLLIGSSVLFIILFAMLKLTLHDTSNLKYQNKIVFLTKDIVKFHNEKNKLSAYNLSEREDYPLLKSFNTSNDVLSPFFSSKEEKPNIVVIVVEGLGSEFVKKNEYGGFTPYLDSLIEQSLYWENFVSTTGRSFGILPSLLGSLPFGEKGFLELTYTPSHLSLISILKANGYFTSYYSGGPSSFDRKVNFLEYNGIHKLIDKNKYGSDYKETIGDNGGFSWGYPDSEIFRKAINSLETEKLPRLDIIMTLSSHEPFEFPDKAHYMNKVVDVLNASNKPESLKQQITTHKDIFGCLLYTDNAIKTFMDSYKRRPDYGNTIFIITGDHRLIPISQKDKLCRFHVPFLIYSPMLKKPETFKSVSSHWDVTPSLLSYLYKNHHFKPLKKVSWIGKGLDTAKEFRNIHKIPLMRYKGGLNDFLYKDYLLSDGELFKINDNFGIYKVTEEALIKTMEDSLMAFKRMNTYVTQRKKIFPDSLNIYVTPKTEFSKEQLATISKYSNQKTFDDVLTIAQDLSSKKDYKTTRLLCDYILNEYPNYTDARILKGRTLAWEKNYKDSEIELLNALERAPFYDDSYSAILDLYWWVGQEDKSESIYKQALKNKITNPNLGYKMAKALNRLNDNSKAIKLMDSILKIYPDNTDYQTLIKSLK